MQLSSAALLFFLGLFCLNLFEIKASKQFGYEIKDFSETDFNLFKDELSSWNIWDSKSEDARSRTKIENITQPKLVLLMDNTTQTFLLGNSYQLPAPHKYIIGSLKLWYSEDDFSDGSTLKLEVFIASIYSQTMEELQKPCFTLEIPGPEKQSQPHFEYIYFGGRYNESEFFFYLKFSIHSHGSHFVKPKSFALRDLRFHLNKELQDTTYPLVECHRNTDLNENLICQDCAENCETCFGPKPSQCLSCSAGNHWHGSGCTSCHGFCGNCTGPTQHECSGCNFPFYDYGNGSCSEACPWSFHVVDSESGRMCLKYCKSNEYAWRESFSCIPSCPAPLVAFTDSQGILFCENPCSKQNDFLYTNGSCLAVCPSPLIMEYFSFAWVRLCKNPCKSTSDYIFWDGSCLKECPSPFKIRSDSMANYCEKPCGPADLYLYSNGSCLSVCPEPLVPGSDQGVRYCRDPCKSSSDYFYANKSCSQECPHPFRIFTDWRANFCMTPCDSEDLYFYNNGSCLSNCSAPLKAFLDDGIQYCRSPCGSTSDYLYLNGLCFKECPFPLQIVTDKIANYCVSPCRSEDLYLYSNGSCYSACPVPLVSEFDQGIRYCRNPCESTSDYLYANKSCLKECLAPLKIKTEPAANFCVNPCPSASLYLYQNSSCLSTCPAPLVAELKGWVKFCRNPCNSASDYLYASRLCLKGCPAPLRIRSEPAANYCVNPCHSKNLYLYQNGSCLSACPFPGKIKEEFGVKYCLPPCSLTGEYILKDGSCSAECPTPLIQRTVVSVGTFCLSPCESDSHFISRNGLCLSNCPNNFETRVEYGVKYCIQPCRPEQYYFPLNKSCLERCPDSLQVMSEAGAKFCSDPCLGSEGFIYDDQSCHERCALPLIIEERNHCKSPCLKENEYVYADGDCQETCEDPYTITTKGPYKMCEIDLSTAQWTQVVAMGEIIKISNAISELGGILNCLIDAGDPTSLLMMPLLDMFQSIIHTEIVLPTKTKFILGQSSLRNAESRTLSFDKKFVRIAIFSGIALLISGLLKLGRFSHETRFHQLLVKGDFALRWNTLIPLFISMSGDLLLFSLVEGQREQTDSPRNIFCILLIILVLSQIYRISQRRREADLLLLPRWRFLFEIFIENQRFFILSYFARLIAYHLVIGLPSESPQSQAFLIVLMSCGMCFYLVSLSPIAKKICQIPYLVAEFALLLYNFIFGILAIFDLSDGLMADIFGQLMRIIYLITSVIIAIIIVLKIFHGVYSLYKTSRTSQTDHIQLSEMNQESDPDSQPESVRFEPLNQEEEEENSEDQNNSDSEEDCIEPSIAVE